jgi:hypothetical protein
MYSLGRLEEFDERSRDFPIRGLLTTQVPRSYTWKCTTVLNQGNIGACTGFAWAAELAARPKVISNITNQIGFNLYYRAQHLDEWAGNNYEGSSVLGAVRAVQEIYPGAIPEYRWAFGLDDLIMAVGHVGPAVAGIPWYSDMFTPDGSNTIHVGGDLVGGHAILVNGVNIANKVFKLHNSWGNHFGNNGSVRISFDDMKRLLRERGEACIPVRRGLVTV